jgi:hypothetical protein
MPERDAVALAAKREAYAMCKGCPLTPRFIKSFVAQWVASELAWFDRQAKGEGV